MAAASTAPRRAGGRAEDASGADRRGREPGADVPPPPIRDLSTLRAEESPLDLGEPGGLIEPPSIPPPPAPETPTPAATPTPAPPTDADAAAAEQRVREKVAAVRFEEQRIRAEADRRMEEAERLQNESPTPSLNSLGEPPAPEPEPLPPRRAQPCAEGLGPAALRHPAVRRAERARPRSEPRRAAHPGGPRSARALDAGGRAQAGRNRRAHQGRRSARRRRQTARGRAGRRRGAAAQARRDAAQRRGGRGARPRGRAARPRSRGSGAPLDRRPAAPRPRRAPPSAHARCRRDARRPFTPPLSPVRSTAPIGLNSVTFEELRSQGLSVTQSTRLLAHRERLGGFSSIDDLDQVAGFPPDLLADVKSRATL